MLKLDKQYRLQLSKTLLDFIHLEAGSEVYCVYDKKYNAVALKNQVIWGEERVVDILTLDSHGRLKLSPTLRQILDVNMESKVLVWIDENAIYIEKQSTD
ncbi:MAG: hypothetical protein ACI4VQ_08065 [Clostridia bacterium]